MSNHELSEKLKVLATSAAGRSNMARLRDIFDDVEFAIKAGVPISTVHATVSNSGLQMTDNAFRVGLTRIRKERSSKTTAPPAAKPALPASKAVEEKATQEAKSVRDASQVAEEKEPEPETQGEQETQGLIRALSSESRDADMKKYSIAKPSLKDRFKK